MYNITKQALLTALLFTLFSSVGCTTVDSLDSSKEALVADKIRVGDDVFLHYDRGYSQEIEITHIGEESLSGEAEEGRKVVVNYDDLTSIGHKRVEVMKTTAATVGIIALSPLLLLGVFAAGAGY